MSSDIIKKFKILTKQCTDTIHDVITTNCQKYTSSTVLKYVNVSDKVNKLPWARLLNINFIVLTVLQPMDVQ